MVGERPRDVPGPAAVQDVGVVDAQIVERDP
jgi:hypothetical protein